MPTEMPSAHLRQVRHGAAICTISTRSHLAFALTLLRSAEKYAPDASRYLLLVDDPCREVRLSSSFEVVHPVDVVDDALFSQLVYKYNAAELCFTLKPLLMRRLLDAGFSQVHYLDGDTWLVGDFGLVQGRLAGHSVQLTPHLRTPLPLDGRNPTELSLLRSGTYNAGYVGVTQSAVAREFLDWWAERVQRWGINEPRFGMSGDQKWLDPVPNIFSDVVISPDPGVNAAYWNLSGHRLEMTEGSLTVDGQPLVFLHLSGFDPGKPDVLSRFQNRIDSEQSVVLSGLLHAYAEEVWALGHRSWSQTPYAYRRWWHSRFLPIRVARALLFHYRESRVNREAQSGHAPSMSSSTSQQQKPLPGGGEPAGGGSSSKASTPHRSEEPATLN